MYESYSVKLVVKWFAYLTKGCKVLNKMENIVKAQFKKEFGGIQ